MSRETHVRICGSVGVKFPCATRLIQIVGRLMPLNGIMSPELDVILFLNILGGYDENSQD